MCHLCNGTILDFVLPICCNEICHVLHIILLIGTLNNKARTIQYILNTLKYFPNVGKVAFNHPECGAFLQGKVMQLIATSILELPIDKKNPVARLNVTFQPNTEDLNILSD